MVDPNYYGRCWRWQCKSCIKHDECLMRLAMYSARVEGVWHEVEGHESFFPETFTHCVQREEKSWKPRPKKPAQRGVPLINQSLTREQYQRLVNGEGPQKRWGNKHVRLINIGRGR